MQRIGLQMRSLAPYTVGEFAKEQTRLGPKSDFFFSVRYWMCGVSACENMQKRVSHGETLRVGSSELLYIHITTNRGKYFLVFSQKNRINMK